MNILNLEGVSVDEAKFLEQNHLVGADGRLNDKGWQLFSILLDFVGPYPDLTPGIMPSPYGIFDKFLSKVVPGAQELVLIRDGKIYLTYRNDSWWKGWHVPGGFIRPRETVIQTCQRIADSEIPGVKITDARIIKGLSVSDNPRFAHVVLLVRADFQGEPTGGEWFSEFPPDFLEIHRRYLPILIPLLK